MDATIIHDSPTPASSALRELKGHPIVQSSTHITQKFEVKIDVYIHVRLLEIYSVMVNAKPN